MSLASHPNRPTKGLNIVERLDNGEVILGDGGYVFALEKRGYVKAGHWTTEAAVEHPNAVKQLALDFARAGGDVTQTFTYSTWDLELPAGCHLNHHQITRAACDIAKEVAGEKGTLVAGAVTQTGSFRQTRDKARVHEELRRSFEPLVENGVDFLVVEYFQFITEMEWAIELGLSFGLPLAATMCIGPTGDSDGVSAGECAVRMARAGAPIIGLNCKFDPATHLQTMAIMKCALEEAGLSPHLMIQPNGYMSPDGGANGNVDLPEFPLALEPRLLTRFEVGAFAREAYDLGVRYIGGCCGFEPYHVRALGEELAKERGRWPEGSDKSDHDLAVHRKKGEGRREFREKGSKEYWVNLQPATGRPMSSCFSRKPGLESFKSALNGHMEADLKTRPRV